MSKFKMGDKVRLKGVEAASMMPPFPPQEEMAFVVTGVYDDAVEVEPIGNTKSRFTVDAELFTSIAPTDPKRDFLERLQKLLREFDANIELAEDFPDCPYIKFNIGDNFVKYEDLPLTEMREIITADNIMDFDKE